MENQHYSEKILEIVEKIFNKIIIGIIIALFVLSIVILLSDINNFIAYIDMASAILFSVMILMKVSIRKKISIIIIISYLVAIFIFPEYGFTSTAILLLVMGSLLSVLLLARKLGIIFSLISFAVFGILWILTVVIWSGSKGDIGTAKWIAQLIAYALYLLIANGIVYVMREYLINSIQEMEKSNQKIYELAYFDNLTKLPNRSLFEKTISDNIVSGGYLVLIDVKNMNVINKLYTESIGNAVIVEISKVLTDVFIESKYIARAKDNEFILWFDNIMDIQELIENGIKTFNKKFYFRNMSKKIEFHISYIYCSEVIMEIEACYDKLQLALHYAKSAHRISYYDKELEEIIEKEKLIEKRLEEAMNKADFEMYYQEKVNSKTDEVYGVEALARWKSEELGFVSPVIFIPMIETMNLAIEFGRITVNNVFADYHAINEKYGEKVAVSINTSPTLLLSEGFSKWMYQATKKHGVEPSKFIIEITEDVMIEEIDIVNVIFRQLKSFGFRISLDDFGKGYSSLNHLVKLDIDEIKLDKSFVSQIVNSKKIVRMIDHVIQISKEIGIDIVAEGVETKEQVEILTELECFHIQGYYYSRPESIR